MQHTPAIVSDDNGTRLSLGVPGPRRLIETGTTVARLCHPDAGKQGVRDDVLDVGASFAQGERDV
ncbi:hypothetical protein PSP6_630015 [Paraburkholderia tropica]|nr:hypothetical protein PSP6_630015 [Paraburkholderia tropica]